MPELACRDLGMDCDHVITGATFEEVVAKAHAHAQADHPHVLASMSTPEEMAVMDKLLTSKIRTDSRPG